MGGIDYLMKGEVIKNEVSIPKGTKRQIFKTHGTHFKRPRKAFN